MMGAEKSRALSAASIRIPRALVDYVPVAACPRCTPESACAPILNWAPLPSPPPEPVPSSENLDPDGTGSFVSPFLSEDFESGAEVPPGR